MSEENSNFRVVLVGAGNIARTYLGAVENLDGLEVAGVVSRSGRRPEGGEGLPVWGSIQEAAGARDFDAVVLCTPNGVHHEGCVEAAGCGKHVLVEKVLDVTRENMTRAIEACEAAGVRLGVSYQRRWSPHNVVVKRLLDSGELGRVFAADMRVKFWRDDAYYASGDYRGGYAIDGGGPFIQQAAHQVDLMCWFFGMPEQVVSMLGTFAHEIEVEDHGVAMLRYADGMVGTLTASSACRPGFSPVLEVHSTKGSFVMENDVITEWNVDGAENPAAADGEFVVHSGADSAAVSDTSGHEAVVVDFVEAVREGRAPAVDGRDGARATELVLRIYEGEVSKKLKS